MTLLSCACFNTRSSARAVTSYYDRALKDSGLRITQFAILGTIRAAGSISMNQLATILHLDPSTLTRTLQPLENKGLLNIEEGGDDRRTKEVVLTAKGHRAAAAAHEQWQQAQEQLRERVGGERFDRLIDDLQALTRAVRS